MERIPRRALAVAWTLAAVFIAILGVATLRPADAAAAKRPFAVEDAALKPLTASKARPGSVTLTLTVPADQTAPVRVTVGSPPLSGVSKASLSVDGASLAGFMPANGRFYGATGTIARTKLYGPPHRVVVTITRRTASTITLARTISLPTPAPVPTVPEPTPPAPAPTPAPAPAPEPPGGEPAPTPAPAPTPTAPARILWGAWVDGDAYGAAYDDPPWDMAAQALFEQHAGKSASIVHYGQSWRRNGVYQPFYPGDHQRVRDHGAIPLLDWNPWDSSAGGSSTQPDFALARIIAGDHDAYIASWATAARNWGHPFFLRLAHEMNGTWFPWSERANGNVAGQYVASWRHIHDIFRSVGATNVTWVWSPNAIYSTSIPLTGLYPGDAYVDWVAIDGYNWGTNPAKPDAWKSFGQVVGPTYDALGDLAPAKPVMLAELGSTEHGGSKAAWIADAFAQTPAAFPRIRAAVWFNWDADGMDWRIESSASAQGAFADGLASSAFVAAEFAAAPAGVIEPPV